MTLTRRTVWCRQITAILGILCCYGIQAQVVSEPRAVPVITAAVNFERQTSRLEVVGTAEAVRSVVIYPAVADKVTSVNFVAGQFVERGAVLLQLDARRQQVALDRAMIQLADAERTLTRLQQSRNSGAIAQIELDDAITTRDLLKVAVTEARTELDDRTVRAPFAGVAGITDVEQGDRITVQTPITTIDARQQLLINFSAPEAALGMLHSNASVELQAWQGGNQRLRAEITQVDSRIDSTNRTVRARALLNNSADIYRPGMSFRVVLQQAGNEYAVIPEAAMLWGATSPYIWLVAEGKAKRVDVQIQQRLTGRLLVSGAISANDELIIEGVQSIRQGQAVIGMLAQQGGL